ncbi:MAG: prolipoprotein diacylglyceryl transferase family protein, partial [Planctomycetota bacterium]
NGELYGRVTDEGVFGAMRFPTDPEATRALGLMGLQGQTRSKELAIQVAYDHLEWSDVSDRVAPAYSDGTPIPWDQIKTQLDWGVAQELVPFRHPSQLYEGLAEGLLLGFVLFVLFRLLRKRPLGPGGYGGIFLLGYGVARSLIENLRQPDTQFTSADDPVGTVFMGLTMGQTLSAFMIAAGLYFTWRGIRTRGTEAAPAPSST